MNEYKIKIPVEVDNMLSENGIYDINKAKYIDINVYDIYSIEFRNDNVIPTPYFKLSMCKNNGFESVAHYTGLLSKDDFYSLINENYKLNRFYKKLDLDNIDDITFTEYNLVSTKKFSKICLHKRDKNGNFTDIINTELNRNIFFDELINK